jgi:hypothetical protein
MPAVSPFDTFECFPTLSPELRLRVWVFASHLTRFIEISSSPATSCHFRSHHVHNLDVVARKSRKAPAILHVNHEAREEGLKFYQVRFVSGNGLHYYNPSADVILFREDDCSSAIADFMNLQIRPHGEAPRVAIVLNAEGYLIQH